VSLSATYPPGTAISTNIISLKASLPSNSAIGYYVAATIIKTTLPDLRVFVRTGATTYTQLSAPLYAFQDWTIIKATRGSGGTPAKAT